jgi:hypothetical protein
VLTLGIKIENLEPSSNSSEVNIFNRIDVSFETSPVADSLVSLWSKNP